MRRRIMLLMGAVLVAPALLGSGTASASTSTAAAENEINTAAKHPMTEHAKECHTGSNDVRGCVMPYGDILWLDDLEYDGWGVKLKWQDVKDGRKGECHANHGAAGGWARCNKDFKEGHEIRWWLVWYEDGAWHRDPGPGWYWSTTV